jgi:tyrosyl-tRNA synthetase
MTNKRVGAYVGVDPTAASLHVGHLLPLMSLFWMYVHGYHTVSLLGGATAKIGDPTGRLTSRTKEHSAIRAANMVNMHYQMKKLWVNVEEYGKKFGYNWEWAWHRELVNNNAWINKLTVLELLQVLGPGMRLGTMLARDTVKNKMEKGDGMSYAEFSYPILQAWDWWHMYHTKGIQMQIGGADQYGNIVAGLNAVKYISANHPDPDVRRGKDVDTAQPFGFTVPLLTTASGQKFGKSAGNAVWLDKELTSTFELYGFWMRQADADMPRYLRYFTFIPSAEIDKIVEEHNQAPHERKAQHVLASNFLELVHGREEARAAEAHHRLLYGKPTLSSVLETPSLLPSTPSAEEAEPKGPTPLTLNNAPSLNMTLPRSVLAKSIGKIVYAAGLAESSSEGHRLVSKGGMYIGAAPAQKKAMDDAELKFTPIKNWIIADTSKFLIGDELLVLRKGKHNIRIVKLVDDDEWALGGKKYPGEGGQGHAEEGEATVTFKALGGKGEKGEKGEKGKAAPKKKSFWSQFAPEVDAEEPSVIRKIGTRPDFAAPAGKPGAFSVRRPTVVGRGE